jgi:branched-subunit amino acid transport protein
MNANIWLVMIAGGIITFLTRFSFIAAFSRREVPNWLRRALRYVPPAVLSVIIFQGLLFPNGEFYFTYTNARLFAGLVATLVAWRSRSALLTILAGMAALLVFQTILGV